MKRSGTTNRFWWVLGRLNVLAMVYPIMLVRRADSVDAQLLATLVLTSPHLSCNLNSKMEFANVPPD